MYLEKRGFQKSPGKCEVIKKTPATTNVSEVKSFLAITNYVSKFIPNYSSTTEPLRVLLKKDAEWQWNNEQQNTFDQLKADLSSETVMTYFDPNKETQIIVDAKVAK